jgi:hypothetical protein
MLAGAAGDAVDTRGLTGFPQGYHWQDGGEPPGRLEVPAPGGPMRGSLWSERRDNISLYHCLSGCRRPSRLTDARSRRIGEGQHHGSSSRRTNVSASIRWRGVPVKNLDAIGDLLVGSGVGSQPSHRKHSLHRGRSCSPWHGQRVERLVSTRLGCDPRLMRTLLTNRDKNHRFPAEIISHDIWLYFRFCLSYRDAVQAPACLSSRLGRLVLLG